MPILTQRLRLLSFAGAVSTQTGTTFELDSATVTESEFVTLAMNLTTATAGTLDVAINVSWDKGTTFFPIKKRQSSTTISNLGAFEQITTATGRYTLVNIPLPANINAINAVATIATGPYTLTLDAYFSRKAKRV